MGRGTGHRRKVVGSPGVCSTLVVETVAGIQQQRSDSSTVGLEISFLMKVHDVLAAAVVKLPVLEGYS